MKARSAYLPTRMEPLHEPARVYPTYPPSVYCAVHGAVRRLAATAGDAPPMRDIHVPSGEWYLPRTLASHRPGDPEYDNDRKAVALASVSHGVSAGSLRFVYTLGTFFAQRTHRLHGGQFVQRPQ